VGFFYFVRPLFIKCEAFFVKKIGRNDPCACGSGKKFKQCCQPRLEAETAKEKPDAREIANIFRASLAHHQADRWAQAEAGYLTVLQMAPRHADALHLLGVLARKNGNPERAIELIEQALSIKSDYAEACNNLGIALKETGQLDAAIHSYRRALKLSPDLVDAHYNLGIAFKEQGKLDNAISSYQAAIQAKPEYAEAHNNLGIVFKQRGQLNGAIACYEEAIRLKPDFAEAHNNLGVAFRAQGQYEMAVASYQRTISLKPDFFEAYNNLGNVLQELGRMDEALGVYVRVLGYEPNSYEAHNNLGAVFQDQGEFERAFACYQRALALNPNYAEAHNNLGNALRRQGKIEEAVASYRTAISLKPDVVALSNLGNAYKELGDADAAIAISHQAWELDPEGFSGLTSAIRLAVLYYLKGDVSKANETLSLSQYILNTQEEKFAAGIEYWALLHKLLQDGQTTAVGDNEQQVGEILYVIGESHMLSVHNRSFIHDGSRVRCQGHWVEGCKQWHLANSEENTYKYSLRRLLNAIPRQAKIMLMIGEIDCRIDEGIMAAWKKSNGKRIEDITSSTVIGYLNYVSHIAAGRDQKLIICGVPAPNVGLDLLTQKDSEQFLSLVANFNSALREHALGQGWGFLDLFAMTNCGMGRSDGRWHLDQHHLRPAAYIEAFGKFLIGMTFKPSSPMQSETLTIEDALQRAVAHHQAGQLQDAERLYGAILQAQPDHADANHNFGVLAAQLKQLSVALPYFKRALEANANQGQYWLSYIDALIQAGQIDAARQVLAQGQQRGLQGEAVALLAGRLGNLTVQPAEIECAISHREAGRYKEAALVLQSWIANSHQDASGHALLAQMLSLCKQDEPAWEAMNTALSINPTLPIVQRNHARLLLKQQKVIEALQAARSAYQGDTTAPENQLVLAAVLGADNQNDQAFQLIESALQSKPDYAEAFASRALLKLRVNDLAGALADAEKALSIKPAMGQLWGMVGSLRHQLKNLPGAIEALEKAVEYEPDNVGHLVNLGELKRQTGALGNAIDLLEKAAAIAPSNSSVWVNLGTALQESNRISEAQAAYMKALEILPEQAEVASNLGVLAKDEGNWEEALYHFDQALMYRPASPVILTNRAAVLNALGQYDEAEQAARHAIELEPMHAEAHINLGVTLQESGRLDEAEASYRKALEIKPDYAEAHGNLGITLQELGRPDEAETSYRRALEIKPDYEKVIGNLSVILQQLGRQDEAEASYRRILQIKPDDVGSVTTPPVTALLPFGRSGSLFFHSLFDGHPEIATLPGVYFKGWFGMDQWKRFSPNIAAPGWRERLAKSVLKEYQPLFDARSKKNVAGKPVGNSEWLAKTLGFTDMGADRSQHFVVDQDAFAKVFIALLAPLSNIGQKDCFELIHRAFEIAIRGNTASGAQENGHIFYHIHNPDTFELAQFLQHYPQARLLHIMRNPVQSMESWMLIERAAEVAPMNSVNDAGASSREWAYRINCWNRVVKTVTAMFAQMQSPFGRQAYSRGVKLEDVKRNALKVMPRIAAWMGISDHPALYDASFCGLQYWGPASKVTGKIAGFDTKAIDQPVGRLLGLRDVTIFETLFWPLSSQYGYSELDSASFRQKLAEIRPWLDEPLEFEKQLYAELPDHSRPLETLPPYSRLHNLLQQYWSVLERDGTYQGMVPPLDLN
jgi:tetratricopeptide (TPR) repeat protein